MLCENCKKNKYALLITKTINGEKSDLRLCYQCSLELQSPLLGLSGLLNEMVNLAEASNLSNIKVGPTCLDCGFTMNDLNEKGKVGCSTCYKTFSKEIRGIMENIQWSMEHKGKIPQQNGKDLITKKEIKELRKQLEKAVAVEEYEEAARLRDQIKLMKSEGI